MGCSVIDGERGKERLFATFFVDQLEFALEVAYVHDAIPRPKNIVPLPAAPDYLSGIISLRDNIVPVVDTRKRFRMPAPSMPSEGHIAVTCCNSVFMGLTFDRINEVIRVRESQMETLAPQFQVEGNLVADVIKLDSGERLVQVIDPLSMFDFAELPESMQHSGSRTFKRGRADDEKQQVLSFHLGNELFGIEIGRVREIMKVPEISQRVLVEDYILGIIAVRDERLSVMDLRMFLEGKATVPTSEHRIVIIEAENLSVGILVDGIREVLSYNAENLRPMPPLARNRHAGGFKGIVEQPESDVVLLDMTELLQEARERIAGHLRVNHDLKTGENGGPLFRASGQNQGEERNTYITFALDRIYGVSIENIREIVPVDTRIHHLPGQVDYVNGFMNLRSEMIPVINLRRYFEAPESLEDAPLIMIFTWESRQVGILIDRLLEIVTLETASEQAVPKLLARREESRFKGLLKRIIEMADDNGDTVPTLIIDVPRFMTAVTENTESAKPVSTEGQSQTISHSDDGTLMSGAD